MSATNRFNFILDKLVAHAASIEICGRLSLFDRHSHAEDFYAHLLNLVFDWNLENLNGSIPRAEGIDLVDATNQFVVQVSATATKGKVESSLAKGLLANYPGHRFKFVSISKDASHLRSKTFENPHELEFDPSEDIYDVGRILQVIKPLRGPKLDALVSLVKDELGDNVDPGKLETNLAHLIGVLAEESIGDIVTGLTVDDFEVDRKIDYNELVATRAYIEEHSVQYARLDRIYSEFDKQGVNKSLSVLSAVRTHYVDNLTKKAADDLFLAVLRGVEETIINSANFRPMPQDELRLYILILVVDAFIRCKIFKNPPRYQHVAT